MMFDSQWLCYLFSIQHLDEHGFIKVSPSYQLEGLPHVFSLGDVSTIPMTKMAKTAMHQAELVIPNIKKQAAGKKTKALSSKWPSCRRALRAAILTRLALFCVFYSQ